MHIPPSLHQGDPVHLASHGRVPVQSGRDVTIIMHSQVSPAGCSIGTGIYTIHRNPLYSSRSDEYLSERWVFKSRIRDRKIGVSSAEYTPFSQGTRACVGRHLAQLEHSSRWRASCGTTASDGQPRLPNQWEQDTRGQALGERTRRICKSTTTSSARNEGWSFNFGRAGGNDEAEQGAEGG